MSIGKIINVAELGPLCVNCAHSNAKIKGLPPMCASPRAIKSICLVTGEQAGPTCAEQRKESGECTPAGALFQLKAAAPERVPYGKPPRQRDVNALSATERNNLHSLLRKCRAGVEDIDEVEKTHGFGSKEWVEVNERYKKWLSKPFAQILMEAVRNLDRDLG